MLIYVYVICCYFLVSTQVNGRIIKRIGAEESNDSNQIEPWEGKWFPFPPHSKPHHKADCDDGEHSIAIDYDPKDKRHSYNYLCLGNRTIFAPTLTTSPILEEHFVPRAYRPAKKCLDETIVYEDKVPTYGHFRPLAPKYGTYQYLPPQRWLHSLAEGAIVMLYHPCASEGQVEKLANTLKGCLYRHIVTPSLALSSQRPLALLAWGKCLQMSVIDDHIVVDFIKQNAKKGPITQHTVKNLKLYEADLLSEAHLVTDQEDIEICGYKEM